jgi:hypothetical protein
VPYLFLFFRIIEVLEGPIDGGNIIFFRIIEVLEGPIDGGKII